MAFQATRPQAKSQTITPQDRDARVAWLTKLGVPGAVSRRHHRCAERLEDGGGWPDGEEFNEVQHQRWWPPDRARSMRDASPTGAQQFDSDGEARLTRLLHLTPAEARKLPGRR
jgi:hypothetical protein